MDYGPNLKKFKPMAHVIGRTKRRNKNRSEGLGERYSWTSRSGRQMKTALIHIDIK
jgi:hypothetical protein